MATQKIKQENGEWTYVQNGLGIAGTPEGGSDKWEFIGEFNVGEEDVIEWIVDKYADGTPISLKQMYFEINFKASPSTTAKTNVLLGNPAYSHPFATSVAYAAMNWIDTKDVAHKEGCGCHVINLPNGDKGCMDIILQQTAQYTLTLKTGGSGNSDRVEVYRQCLGGIAFMSQNASAGLIGANSTVKIWGIKI